MSTEKQSPKSVGQAKKVSGVRKVTVDPDDEGQRIDNYLQRVTGGLPRSKLYKMIRKGELRINSGRVKPEYRVKAGDLIRIPPIFVEEKAPIQGVSPRLASLLKQSVIYEDDALLVLNKPAGLAVHGGSGVNIGLIESMRQIRPDARCLELVHRLDRDTSGCLMIAKKRSMLRRLHANLREGHIKKHYQALVAGRWDKRVNEINAPLVKNQLASGERYVKVQEDGKRSITRFSVARASSKASLLDINLLTGRTHQIRVHTQYAGHSIIGDVKYGDHALNQQFKANGHSRLFLHAAKLVFRTPVDDTLVEVVAPLDDAFTAVLDQVF